MDATYLSLLIFCLLTGVYYGIPSVGKLPITLATLSDLPGYTRSNLSRLGLYFLAIVVSQFAINAISVSARCGTSAGRNVGAAALMTFIPWVLIFGMMVAALIIWPSMKTAFSDVIGYFVVSSRANTVLSELLVDAEVAASGADSQRLASTAETIMKLCGNKSILINQIVPENFVQMWDTLAPLFRADLQIEALAAKKSQLLEIAVLRDNIGEGMWFLYTALLVTSIVSFNIVSRGCVKDPAAMKADHDAFVANEAKLKAERDAASNATVYTL